MALSNINKFSPYTSTGNQSLIMPKLKFRFRVQFSKFGGAYGLTGAGADSAKVMELTKQIVTCGRPAVTFAPVTLETYNSKVYVFGKPEWQTIEVVVRDDMSSNVSRAVGEQVQKQFDFMEQASAAAAGDYKFGMTIDMLDGGNGASDPAVLESWEITGCFLSDVKWNDLDYASNDPVLINMTVRFDNALQTDPADSHATGVGVSVGRTPVGNIVAP